MIGNKILVTLSLAATLGVLGVASAAALENSGRGTRGGFVVPGSLDGVNPAYHPDIFGNPAVASEYGFVRSRDGHYASTQATKTPYGSITTFRRRPDAR